MSNKVKPDNYPIPKICPYCDSKVILASNKEVYGRTYGNGLCYKCINCDSYVGVHSNSNFTPLGRLANKELRDLKQECHRLFDPLWKSGRFARSQLYKKLAIDLKMKGRDCHIGHFDNEMCKKAIEVIKGWL